jgi:uncharacterized protein (DUF58 family)
MNVMWFKNILRHNRQGDERAPDSGAARRPFRFRMPFSLRPSGGRTPDSFSIDETFLRRLERLNLQAQRALRGTPLSGEHPSRQRLPAAIFSEHRPYSTGDDYRNVDWNAYARQEQVLVKLGETEQDVDVHILLDCSRSMGWGSPPKLVAAQQLVSALGYLAMAHSDRLRVTPFGATLLPSFGPAQSKGRLMELVRFMTAVKPLEQTAPARVLREYPKRYERGGLIIICSDLLSEPAEGLAEGLRALPPPRWQVLVLHLLDPLELQPSLDGPLELEDAETGGRLKLNLDQEAIDGYKRNVAAWQSSLAEACARRGATYAQILTNWPLERSVIPYLRARQVVR